MGNTQIIFVVLALLLQILSSTLAVSLRGIRDKNAIDPILLETSSRVRFEGQEHKQGVDVAFEKFKKVKKDGKTLHDVLQKEQRTITHDNVEAFETTQYRAKEDSQSKDWAPFYTPLEQELFVKSGYHPHTTYKMSLGQVTAIAGDYYGPLDDKSLFSQPNSALAQKSFCKIFGDLFAGHSPTGMYGATSIFIDDMLQYTKNEGVELDKIENYKSDPDPKSAAHYRVPGPESRRILRAFHQSESGYLDLASQSAARHMVYVATYNVDHFKFPEGGDSDGKKGAFEVYERLHRWAQQLDGTCRKYWDAETNKKREERPVTAALWAEGFALHYLTDMFSAGHLRVPRMELVTACDSYILGGFNSKMMHDEDSMFGIWVENRVANAPWLMFGDKKYFLPTPANRKNRDQMKLAVTRSIREILLSQGFKDDLPKFPKLPDDKKMEDHIPRVNHKMMMTRKNFRDRNRCPRYTTNDEGVLYMRSSCIQPDQDPPMTRDEKPYTRWEKFGAPGVGSKGLGLPCIGSAQIKGLPVWTTH